MSTERSHTCVPSWRSDEQDPSGPSGPRAPYFDEELDAWVLSRHRDILAALRNKHTIPSSVKRGTATPPANEALRIRLRSETLTALSPAVLRQWQESLQPVLDRSLNALHVNTPVDVLDTYARPVCLALAAIVTGISQEEAAILCEHARAVSLSTADPNNASLKEGARASQQELERDHFHAKCLALRDTTFVAVSQTIPCMLGNAWYALLRHPAQWRLVHDEPARTDQAIEELLRYAGLTRLIAREATQNIGINGTVVRKGERMLLRVIAGNRDPQQFPDPNVVEIARSAAGHLTLGVGHHSCVGASLIRMALVMTTRSLVERFSSATLVHPVEWQGGAIFQSPQSLWVNLTV